MNKKDVLVLTAKYDPIENDSFINIESNHRDDLKLKYWNTSKTVDYIKSSDCLLHTVEVDANFKIYVIDFSNFDEAECLSSVYLNRLK